MGGDLSIRPWEKPDRERVQSLLRLLSDDAVVTKEDAGTYVAEVDGELVGTVTLCLFTTLTGRKAYLDHLVVAPEWRRRGIGWALVEYAVAEAKAAGASRLDLTANERKRAGQTLYRSVGFRERDTAVFRFDFTVEDR